MTEEENEEMILKQLKENAEKPERAARHSSFKGFVQTYFPNIYKKYKSKDKDEN